MDEEVKQAPATSEKQMDARTIVASDKYAPYVNILWAILDEDKLYAESEVDKMIQDELAHVVEKDINE